MKQTVVGNIVTVGDVERVDASEMSEAGVTYIGAAYVECVDAD